MAGNSIITEEMRSQIGIESEPSVFEIEKEPIRRWAEAVDDPNPLYRDEKFAQKSKYGTIIAPPAFVGNYEFPIKPSGRPMLQVKSPFWRQLNGGTEYEFFKPVHAGDVLTAETRLVDLYERQGRVGIGKMLFQVSEATFMNQRRELVCKVRYIIINYEGPTE